MDSTSKPSFIIHTSLPPEALHDQSVEFCAAALRQGMGDATDSISDVFPMNNPFVKGYAWAHTYENEENEARIEMSFLIAHQNAAEYFRLNFPDENFAKVDAVIKQFEASFTFTDTPEPPPANP